MRSRSPESLLSAGKNVATWIEITKGWASDGSQGLDTKIASVDASITAQMHTRGIPVFISKVLLFRSNPPPSALSAGYIGCFTRPASGAGVWQVFRVDICAGAVR
jgi:hypothetical protein